MKMIDPELQIQTRIDRFAQRGPDEAPERPPKGVGMLIMSMAFSWFGVESV
jgi:hypothetical protein